MRAFSKWGTWQRDASRRRLRTQARIHVPLPRSGDASTTQTTHARQLIVAASPNDEIADTHRYRPDFDRWLVREAEREGALYVDETRVERVRASGPGSSSKASGTSGRPHRARVSSSTPAVRAASSPGRSAWPRRHALAAADAGTVTHFAGVERWDAVNTADGTPPYPIDAPRCTTFSGRLDLDPALQQRRHERGRRPHRSPGGELRASEGAPAWTGCSDRLPSVPSIFVCAADVAVHSRAAGRFPRAARSSARSGRSCRPPPASSIRCCRPVSR